MKILITLLKPFSFCTCDPDDVRDPLFSAQTGDVSGALSYKDQLPDRETKNEILASGKSPEQLSQEAADIEFYVRKAAQHDRILPVGHIYFLPPYVYGVRGIWLMLLAGFVCVGFAGLDECYHQSFCRGPRTFRKGWDRQLRSNDRNFAGTGILLVYPYIPPNEKISKKRRNAKTQITVLRSA